MRPWTTNSYTLNTWVFLGDSITADHNGYVSICEARLRRRYGDMAPRVVNAGVSGDRSVDMLERFQADVMAHRPDLVCISAGVNDVWHGLYDFDKEASLPKFDPRKGVPLGDFHENLEKMARLAAGSKVLLVAPTPIGEDRGNRENRHLRKYVVAMEQVARREQCVYCPMNWLFWRALRKGRRADLTFTLTSDGVHMNLAGAHMMAHGVLSSLGVA